MEKFINNDKTVYKFRHEDGSETTIKFVSSCSCDNELERNKYSIFISSSVGCQQSCKFCYLTTKEIKYKPLTKEQVIKNIIDSVEEFIFDNPELKKYYIKLCWMGMGEDSIIKPNFLYEITTNILKYVIEEKKYAIGLDGVDIATVFPNNSNLKVFFDLIDLNKELEKYPLNPNNTVKVNESLVSSTPSYDSRSIVRVFYSLHSCEEETRSFLIPKTIKISHSLEFLKMLNENGLNIIFHYFFIEGVNDSEKEFNKLLQTLEYLNNNYQYFELRILRLNSCEKLEYIESSKFDNLIKSLQDKTNILKVQYSAGKEIQAACGQFLNAISNTHSDRIG